MKTKIIVLLVFLTASTTYAKYGDYGLETDTGTTSTWYTSWAGIKNKVKEVFVKKTESVQVAQQPQVPAARVPASVPVEPIMEVQTQAKWTENVEKIKSQKVISVLEPGRKFNDSNLVMGRNNIPVFEFKKYNEKKIKLKKVVPIPALDVGVEESLDPNAYKVVQLDKFPDAKIASIKVLDSPSTYSDKDIKQFLNVVYQPAQKHEIVQIPLLEESKKVTKEKIDKIIFSPLSEQEVVLLSVNPLGEEDLKMLRALILYEKKDYCHIASGIFSDLTQSQNTKVKNSAHYHLASCLQVMNLPTNAISEFSKVIKASDDRFLSQSIKAVLEIYQRHHEESLAEVLLNLKDENLIPKESMSDLNYLKAKHYYNKDQYQQALNYAGKVDANNKNYFKAQYLASVAEYFLGKTDQADARSRKLSQDLTQKDSAKDKDILALTNINLGRMAFQKGKFKDSLGAYQKVSKDNSLWLQALTEQGWTQLQAKDAAGAIGNMHSIQSPYFDSVYKPESYIVRGIGYLNICQYADAFRSISYLEQQYLNWLYQMDSYLKQRDAGAVYGTVSKFLDQKSKLDMDGLPHQVIREIARQKDFLNRQESINTLVDEDSAYAFLKTLIDKDKKILLGRKNVTITKIVTLQQKIKKASVTPGAMKSVNQWKMELGQNEDFLATFDFKMATYKEGEDGLKKLSVGAREHIQKVKVANKEQAGKILKNYLSKITKELRKNLENNELLKYEIYAGSGENIRYQVAGGKLPLPGAGKLKQDRNVAAQNWDFKGEFWEDEIGNYRSSLKNNCKKEN